MVRCCVHLMESHAGPGWIVPVIILEIMFNCSTKKMFNEYSGTRKGVKEVNSGYW